MPKGKSTIGDEIKRRAKLRKQKRNRERVKEKREVKQYIVLCIYTI